MSDKTEHPPVPEAFAALGIRNSLLKGLADAKFVKPSEIQALLIPRALAGVDILGQARTGTGKTAAFGLPVLQRATRGVATQAIILVPTRELCVQVETELKRLGQFTPIRVVAVYGGQRISAQMKFLKNGPEVLVGTPGRVIDLLERRIIRFDNIRFIVLDEVDRMLDIGFRDDIRKILSRVSGMSRRLPPDAREGEGGGDDGGRDSGRRDSGGRESGRRDEGRRDSGRGDSSRREDRREDSRPRDDRRDSRRREERPADAETIRAMAGYYDDEPADNDRDDRDDDRRDSGRDIPRRSSRDDDDRHDNDHDDHADTGPQTIFVSATISDEIERLARRYMNDPEKLIAPGADDKPTVEKVEQFFFAVEPWDKYRLLKKLLERENPDLAIVFCRTKHGADKLAKRLHGDGIECREIHGNLNQSQREKVMKNFRTGKFDILVATDLASRGIDVADISHIINYDLPDDPEVYVHRVGRTARMGAQGKAYTFVSRGQGAELTKVENLINMVIQQGTLEGWEPNPQPADWKEGRPGDRGGPSTPAPTPVAPHPQSPLPPPRRLGSKLPLSRRHKRLR